MSLDIYEKLAKYLDSLPAGYPPTESGVELRILRQLFSPEEAALAMHLTLIAEEARVIAFRAGIPLEEAESRLEKMDSKGLIFSVFREGKPLRYRIEQFIVGFWEGQVNRLTPQLVRDFEEYLPFFIDLDLWQEVPQLRTIPVNESIPVESGVLPYERAEKLVRAQQTFSVNNCICRQEKHLLGEGCDTPLETCMSFGRAAERSMRVNKGRAITREEALELLDRAEKAGLVLQTSNSREALFICTCCGCCCGVLRSMKQDPRPASRVSSPFIASLDADACTGDGICMERCQMEAIKMENERAVLDPDRCIGCGLCVPTCPTQALTLLRKPASLQPYVPRNTTETYIKMGRAGGRMDIVGLIRLKLNSVRDRWISARP